MAVTLSQILAEIKKTNSKLVSIEKDVKILKKQMNQVLECVSAENADEFPSLKGNGRATTVPMAAKSK